MPSTCTARLVNAAAKITRFGWNVTTTAWIGCNSDDSVDTISLSGDDLPQIPGELAGLLDRHRLGESTKSGVRAEPRWIAGLGRTLLQSEPKAAAEAVAA